MRLALRPGLDPAGVARLRAALDGLPDELATLLAWHDGQKADFQGTFADGWCLLSADDIAALRADLDADPPAGWRAGWVPWARDDNDSFLVLDPATDGVPVRAVWSGKGDHPPVAPSLTAWFTTLLADFEAGKYVEDPERGDYVNTRRTGADTTPEEGDDAE